MAPPVPLINGRMPSFASIEANVNGKKYRGFSSINYNDKLEKTKQYGTGTMPLGRTDGNYEAEGDCEMYLRFAQQLMDDLGDNFGSVSFPITVNYKPVDGGAMITDTLIGVCMAGVDSSNSQGADASKRKFTLSIMQILWNGKALAPNESAG